MADGHTAPTGRGSTTLRVPDALDAPQLAAGEDEDDEDDDEVDSTDNTQVTQPAAGAESGDVAIPGTPAFTG